MFICFEKIFIMNALVFREYDDKVIIANGLMISCIIEFKCKLMWSNGQF